jgi:hypothetical protein
MWSGYGEALLLALRQDLEVAGYTSVYLIWVLQRTPSTAFSVSLESWTMLTTPLSRHFQGKSDGIYRCAVN